MNLASNLDGTDTTFTAYVIALAVSGIILLVMAAAGFGATTGSRVLSGLIGIAFLGYGFYLAFLLDGGSYWISFYAFIVPVLAIVNVVKSRKAKAEAVAQQPAA